jgi:hypothetical protein
MAMVRAACKGFGCKECRRNYAAMRDELLRHDGAMTAMRI